MRNILVALTFLFFLTSCSVHSNTNTLKGLRKNQSRGYFTQLKGGGADSFTLMIYMNGGQAEEDYGEATRTIDAMREVGLSDKLTVIIETGGVETWQNDFLSNEGSDRILLNNKGFSLLSGTKLSAEMDDTAKLSDFVEKTKLEFPADRYGLIFWGDTTLSANEISSVLKEQALDFIGFDAPSKTSFELSYLLEPCADYVIAQTGNVATGWDYAALLTAISENTSLTTTDIAGVISKSIKTNSVYTLTGSLPGVYCADLTEAKHVAKTIVTTYDALADLIVQGNFAQVATLRSEAAYDATSTYIGNLAKNAPVEMALEMQTAVSSMLRYKDTDTQSLTAYFPTTGFSQIAQDLGIFEAAGLPYTNFISTYMSVCLGAAQYMEQGLDITPSDSVAPSPSPSESTEPDTSPSASVPTTEESSPTPSTSVAASSPEYDWYLPNIAEQYKTFYASVASQLAAPMLHAGENLLSLSNIAGDSGCIGKAYIELYLHMDNQNLALGSAQLSLTENVYQRSFSDDWISINGQTASIRTLSGDELGYLLCPVLKDGKPAYLLIAQNATASTYEVVGALLEQGPYMEFLEPQKGDVIQFQFPLYNQELTYLRNTAHGITLTVADKLTAEMNYVSGDMYIRAVTEDIFGNIHAGDLIDLRLLFTHPTDDGSAAGDTSTPPTE